MAVLGPTQGASYSKVVWSERKARFAAFLIIVFLWLGQDAYRHKYSPEAEALTQFDRLLDKWEIGNKSEVIHEIDSLSHSIRPWEYQDDYDDDEYP